MSDEMNSPRSFRRYALDTLAVLSGILIAFGLDAGWGVLQEREALRESLAGLRREFLETRVQLDSVMAVNERALDASSDVLGMTVSDLDTRSDEGLGALAGGLGRADTFDPGESALDALVAGSILERISNPELRDRVAAWSGRVNDVREEQAEVRRAEAAIKQHLAMSGVYVPRLGQGPSSYSARDRVRITLTDEVARQLYAVRWVAVGLMLAEQRGLSEAADEILGLLDAELR